MSVILTSAEIFKSTKNDYNNGGINTHKNIKMCRLFYIQASQNHCTVHALMKQKAEIKEYKSNFMQISNDIK